MGVDADKKVLVEIENKLLELLKNVVRHTLDDKELATTIEDAKKKSVQRQGESRNPEKSSNQQAGSVLNANQLVFAY